MGREELEQFIAGGLRMEKAWGMKRGGGHVHKK